MLKLKTILQNKLKTAKRIAILGVGSQLRADDAAGMVVAQKLQIFYRNHKKKNKQLKVFLGQTAPENLTGQIKKFQPTHLIIIDAMDFHKPAGSMGILENFTQENASFSTHKMPFKILRDYLYNSIHCDTIIIGIQPESIEFCGNLSLRVKKSIQTAVKAIITVIEGKTTGIK
jgi:hydrogenase 3 maturation protease